MDLFSQAVDWSKSAPLADRMRPRNISEFVGQQKIVGQGTLLRRTIENDLIQSVILFGPPGTGKTTLALIIAHHSNALFRRLNAVNAGVKDIKELVHEAKEQKAYYERNTLVFIDEIHRFNAVQQDALLPFVESGLIKLVGATTENPMFALNKALLSRSLLFELDYLSIAETTHLCQRALVDSERGLGGLHPEIIPAALEHIVRTTNGDVRQALNALELAVLSVEPDTDGIRSVDVAAAEDAVQRRILHYTKNGDEHFDVISAFIKSIRGSDPQAAVYWLARMLYAGEDINYISRRMIILAAEDISLADPFALVLATSAAQAAERIGLPEARIVLAEAVVYLALAPKSNSTYLAIGRAMEQVIQSSAANVPTHLRDAGGGSGARLGYGRGYKYPHEYENHWIEQKYLPEGLSREDFYCPSPQGREKELIEEWTLRTKKEIKSVATSKNSKESIE
ncbi:MAG: replication-associated recombination protein A [Dethiobacter sp.]|nr:replication-associated recombination protein A [Dethiobacter sp.]MCL4463582.1 replication-associated recombination protein A [Bacillota bacterium]MCL5994180.1 replication-associated recombination protein A [Bacillota bacterium]